MKRLLIIGLVVVGIWFLFKSDDAPQVPTEPSASEAVEISSEEVMDDDTEEIAEVDESSEAVLSEEESAAPESVATEEVSVEENSVEELEEAPRWTRRRPRRKYRRVTDEEVQESAPDAVLEAEEDVAEPEVEASAPAASQVVTQEEPAEEEPTSALQVSMVKVYLYEWEIDFSQASIPEGIAQFEVYNNGLFTHYFSLVGGEDFGKIRPG